MTHTPHELHEEFPEHADKIHRLKVEDPHFAELMERYRDVNRAIHRAETDVEPMSDEHVIELRKERLKLKDEIATLLR